MTTALTSARKEKQRPMQSARNASARGDTDTRERRRVNGRWRARRKGEAQREENALKGKIQKKAWGARGRAGGAGMRPLWGKHLAKYDDQTTWIYQHRAAGLCPLPQARFPLLVYEFVGRLLKSKIK